MVIELSESMRSSHQTRPEEQQAFFVGRPLYTKERESSSIPRHEIPDPSVKILTPGRVRPVMRKHRHQAKSVVRSVMGDLNPEFVFNPARAEVDHGKGYYFVKIIADFDTKNRLDEETRQVLAGCGVSYLERPEYEPDLKLYCTTDRALAYLALSGIELSPRILQAPDIFDF